MFSKTEFCLLNFIKITISRYFRISFKPFTLQQVMSFIQNLNKSL
jgi:hypothetical protein